jgi:hypothetical protein
MKKINEQQLNKLIEQSVKKHLKENFDTEGGDDNAILIHEYINVTIKYLERIKKFINHPDANFFLQDDIETFNKAKDALVCAKDLYEYLKTDLGGPQPKQEPTYNEKEFKEPVKPKRSELPVNEQRRK